MFHITFQSEIVSSKRYRIVEFQLPITFWCKVNPCCFLFSKLGQKIYLRELFDQFFSDWLHSCSLFWLVEVRVNWSYLHHLGIHPLLYSSVSGNSPVWGRDAHTETTIQWTVGL